MCDLRQDTCLFGHSGVDPARTQLSQCFFGAFLHCFNCDKNRNRHLVPWYLTPVAGRIFEAKIERYFLERFFRERNFCPRTTFSGKKCRSILSNQVISWYGSRGDPCPLGREIIAKTWQCLDSPVRFVCLSWNLDIVCCYDTWTHPFECKFAHHHTRQLVCMLHAGCDDFLCVTSYKTGVRSILMRIEVSVF